MLISFKMEDRVTVKVLNSYKTETMRKRGIHQMAEQNINRTASDTDEVKFKERKRLLFFGLPWTFTRYTITDELLTVNEGFFTVQENDCYMYKIQDVKMTVTLMERIFGLGSIVCYTGDATSPELKLIHVKHAKEIKSYLLKASETARIKRRTLHTQDIGADLDEMEE